MQSPLNHIHSLLVFFLSFVHGPTFLRHTFTVDTRSRLLHSFCLLSAAVVSAALLMAFRKWFQKVIFLPIVTPRLSSADSICVVASFSDPCQDALLKQFFHYLCPTCTRLVIFYPIPFPYQYQASKLQARSENAMRHVFIVNFQHNFRSPDFNASDGTSSG